MEFKYKLLPQEQVRQKTVRRERVWQITDTRPHSDGNSYTSAVILHLDCDEEYLNRARELLESQHQITAERIKNNR